MKEIGQQLRSAREKKGQSVNEVAVATKINAKTIQSIEDGDLSALPAKPFLRGFIQTYARHLELNVDDIMNRFVEVHGSTKPKIQTTEAALTSQESHEEAQKKMEMYKKVGLGITVVIGGLLIAGIFKIISKYEAENRAAKEHKEAVAEKNPAPTEVAPAPAPSTTAETTTEVPPPDAQASAKQPPEAPAQETAGGPAPVAAATKTEVTAPAPTAKPTSNVPLITLPETVKKEEPKKEETKVVVEEKKEEVEKPTVKTIRPQEVIIEALDKVDVRFQKDGESEKSMKLTPEKVFIIRAKEKVSISISDGGAVNIIHNGRDKGVPGSLGQSVKVNYP